MSNLMKKLYKTIEEKNIKNRQLLDSLFDVVNGTLTGKQEDSVFEDDVLKLARAEAFTKKYIEPIDDFEKQDAIWSDFVTTNEEFQRLGFRVGFQTALKLILESEGRLLPFIRLERAEHGDAQQRQLLGLDE